MGKREKGRSAARGRDAAHAARARGSRLSPLPLLFSDASTRRPDGGFSLIELVIVVTILAVLSLGVIPLVKTSVRRQREYRLRETLREMRESIKEFKRDAVGIQCAGAATASPQPGPPVPPGQQPGQGFMDPRSKVVISDCTIFGVDNPDHYPPDLETLVTGVNVVPRGAAGVPNPLGPGNATDNKLVSLKKKVYLRQIPVDPVTGRAEWDLRSCYDAADSTSWGGENVFDVRSKAEGTALNGEKYSDW